VHIQILYFHVRVYLIVVVSCISWVAQGGGAGRSAFITVFSFGFVHGCRLSSRSIDGSTVKIYIRKVLIVRVWRGRVDVNSRASVKMRTFESGKSTPGGRAFTRKMRMLEDNP
jgi:hypothetical protein